MANANYETVTGTVTAVSVNPKVIYTKAELDHGEKIELVFFRARKNAYERGLALEPGDTVTVTGSVELDDNYHWNGVPMTKILVTKIHADTDGAVEMSKPLDDKAVHGALPPLLRATPPSQANEDGLIYLGTNGLGPDAVSYKGSLEAFKEAGFTIGSDYTAYGGVIAMTPPPGSKYDVEHYNWGYRSKEGIGRQMLAF